jgi:hypothetical protein
MNPLVTLPGSVLAYDQPIDHPQFKGDRTQLFIHKKQLLISTSKGLTEIPPPWKLTRSSLGEPYREVIELNSKAECLDDDPYCYPSFTMTREDAIVFVASLADLGMDKICARDSSETRQKD